MNKTWAEMAPRGRSWWFGWQEKLFSKLTLKSIVIENYVHGYDNWKAIFAIMVAERRRRKRRIEKHGSEGKFCFTFSGQDWQKLFKGSDTLRMSSAKCLKVNLQTGEAKNILFCRLRVNINIFQQNMQIYCPVPNVRQY